MYTTFLFDLDGTLTDPKEGIVNSVTYALRKMGTDEQDDKKLLSFIGPPIQHSFASIYRMNEKQVAEAVTYYREYFQDKGMFENQIYEHIPSVLKDLKNARKRLFVATSKPTIFAKQILEHFQLAHYFEEIVGSNLDGTRIAKTDIIQHILHTYHDLKKEHVVMVGDREHDIIGAQQVGIDSIGVMYGYGSKEELVAAGATHIIEDVEHIERFHYVLEQ
ncbi:phosphoglycolate phosphatase [Bacillus sp. AFS018417]|uniref:HAD family hydrolase n=1 Tax=Bacillus sp. AFS018417 TaxID=2033491 RepID=UPI000BF337D8|nr:HAD family hydrolase [Bacillus sp. AFS018417]PEZ01065.1 phosphoglycolate phosphatase [Bacillus sp. AFS018417]